MSTTRERYAVIIHIHEGKELKNTQFIGKQSPFVTICTLSAPSIEVKTLTQHHGGEAGYWNEVKMLEIDNLNDCLLFSVMNENKNVIIGRLRIPCSELSNQPSEQWYDIYDSNGAISGKLLLTLHRTDYESARSILAPAKPVHIASSSNGSIGGFNQPAANIGGFSQPTTVYQTSQPAANIGGFSQPATVYQTSQPAATIGGFSQPATVYQTSQPAANIGGFSQPATVYKAQSIGGFTQPAATIGGFSQPRSAPSTNIGGFQQPSTVAPNNSFGGFTVSGSTSGGYQQQYCHISGTGTVPNHQANSEGMLSPNLQQPNVTFRGEYIPQTDTANGGRPLYVPAAVVAVPVSPPLAQAHTYSTYPPQQLPQQQPIYQASAPALPAGWEMRYTPDGKPYYLNHNNKTTSWTPPTTT